LTSWKVPIYSTITINMLVFDKETLFYRLAAVV
jgi:hypothetical protein